MVPESEFAADGDCYHRGTLDSSVTVSISHGRISILTRQCGCLFVDFHSYVTCIVVSYIGLMLVDMGKVQYCHGHTRQCTTPSRRFSSVFCTTDVKCIARSYVCRIYTGHILLSTHATKQLCKYRMPLHDVFFINASLASPRALIADSTVGIRAALSPSKTPSTSTDSTTLMLPLLTCRPIPISSFRRAHVR